MNAAQISQALENQRVLIVGDVMLDRYLHGQVNRISPEAPVPVVLHRQTEDRLGGAANVAINIHALGSAPLLCSVTGHDADGTVLTDLLENLQLDTTGIVPSPYRKTTVKTRIIGNQQQMLRIDTEDTHDLLPEEEDWLKDRMLRLVQQYNVNVIILQDYNKGVLSKGIIDWTLRLANKLDIPVAVDPKKRHFLAYRGATLFKPNLKEIREAAPFGIRPELDDLQRAAEFLHEHLQHQHTMITLSEKGLYWCTHPDEGRIFPTIPRNVSDVSGAGDTVISVAALAMAAGLPPELIAALSNLAGGQVCEMAGVAAVRKDLLLKEYELQHV